MSKKRGGSDSEFEEEEDDRKPSAVSSFPMSTANQGPGRRQRGKVLSGKGTEKSRSGGAPAESSQLKWASFSTLASAAGEPPAAAHNEKSQQKARSRGKGRARLPEKLMDYLDSEVNTDVMWWLPKGTAFAFESSRVQEEFLDSHLRGTKMSSFIRSLNRWGFRRITPQSQPKTAMCFHQKFFMKNEPHLLKHMKLSSYTPLSARVDSDADAEGATAHEASAGGTQDRGDQLPNNAIESQEETVALGEQHLTAQRSSIVSLLLDETRGSPMSRTDQAFTAQREGAVASEDPRFFRSSSAFTLSEASSAPLLGQGIGRQPGSSQTIQGGMILPLLQELLELETQRNDAILRNVSLHNLLRDAIIVNGLSRLPQPPPPQPPPQSQLVRRPLDGDAQHTLLRLVLDLVRSQSIQPTALVPPATQSQVQLLSALLQPVLQPQTQSGQSNRPAEPPQNVDDPPEPSEKKERGER